MRAHPKELGVQMAATACLYNLSKSEMGQKLHPKWLAQIVMATMDAMHNFPNHQQVRADGRNVVSHHCCGNSRQLSQ